MAKPTTKQKLAFTELLKKIIKEEPFELKRIMKKAGYKEATAHNPDKNLTSKDGWKQLLAKLNEEEYLNKLNNIALSGDNDAALKAIKMILLDLKGKGADQKTKLIGLFERIDGLNE